MLCVVLYIQSYLHRGTHLIMMTNIKLVIITSAILFSTSCLVIFYRFSDDHEEVAVSTQKPWLAPVLRRPCTCQPGSFLLKDQIPKDPHDNVTQRRKAEFEKYKNRTTSELSKLLLALPNSPLQYPIQGFTVQPLKSSLIPGLALYARKRISYKVTLNVSKGILSTDEESDEVAVTGKGESSLTLESVSLPFLNAVLAKISYQSTIYHIYTGDIVSFRFENHEALFPIVIKQPQLPVMFDTGTDINSQVTVAIKTFLRYDRVRVLLSSIRSFYPKITVVIADDSIERENLTGENILQYFMPPAMGWFAGRNLAVSQVTTKYFLWVDDDFVFTKDTQIENMVEVMEAVPELDVVGGSVQGNRFYFSIEYDEGEETEGGCLYRKSRGKFHALPGFPKCSLASGVVNFFLARTDSVQKVRFDPLLKRVAHSEFFMDGLGSLMVATCEDVSIGHQPSRNSAQYSRFRASDNSDRKFKLQLHYFKNHLKCIKYG